MLTNLWTFAATWGIQDLSAARLRLNQLRNSDFPTADRTRQQNVTFESVRTQEEVEQSIRALLFDEEMETLGQSCIDDGEWDPTIQVNCQDIYFLFFFFTLSLCLNITIEEQWSL